MRIRVEDVAKEFGRTGALPRVVRDVHEAVARLRGGQDTGHATLLAPIEGWAAPTAASSRDARADIVGFAPERVTVDVDSAQPGLLVLAEAWYPGWRATVNGAPAACVAANAWMRAVPVPAGASRVVVLIDGMALRLDVGVRQVTGLAELGPGNAL